MLARHLNLSGVHDALHPRDYGRTGERDDEVLARCIVEDRVIVTENALDFQKLVGREELHPGLIILPNVTRDASLALLRAGIAFLERLGRPQDVMVNHVLEIREGDRTDLYALAKGR